MTIVNSLVRTVLFSTFLFGGTAHAVTRSLQAAAEQAQVSLESVNGNANLYYLKVDNLDSPLAGRPVLVKRLQSGNTEDFSFPKLEFFIRLGGNVANSYTNPPTVGILTFNNKDLKLSTSDKPVQLAEAYANAECLNAPAKTDAEKWLAETLTIVKETCGTAPSLNVSWSSFEKVKRAGLACNAREALLALNELCKDADYKKASAAIKTLTIVYGPVGSFKKSGSTVTYIVPTLPENTRLQAKTFFEDNL
ncbi:MAG: hypothetical protein EOP05_03790 [Proteobacteria bacterium]|nr:MAG: hypothetical protein EOP05_03790 [Pseudomonadota bacterium]